MMKNKKEYGKGAPAKFDRISEYALTCWTCMVVMQSSKEGYCCLYLSTKEENERAHARIRLYPFARIAFVPLSSSLL